jgi:hypothetical protein
MAVIDGKEATGLISCILIGKSGHKMRLWYGMEMDKMEKEMLKKLEQFALKETNIRLEAHFNDRTVKDLPKVDNKIRIIEIEDISEFGIETDISDKKLVNIELGFAGVTLTKEALMRAICDWLQRDMILEGNRK